MEAPVTGALPPTPSNFGAVAAARGAAAENTGGLFQPAAGETGGSPPKQAWSQPQQPARQPADPSVTARQQSGNAAPDEMAQPSDNPLTEGDKPESQLEQLYDEHGDPIDMVAYEQQRAEIFQRVQAAIDEGRFPYEELKSLPIDVPAPDGTTRQMTLEELKSGNMRQMDYTRKLQQAYALRDQAQHILNLERARNAEWRDPAQLRAGLRMLGLEESFKRAAYGWAEERVRYNRLPPNEKALFDQMQQARAQAMQAQAQMRQQAMQQQQAAGPDPATMHAAKQIEQLMPRALKAAGVGNYAFAQAKFVENLEILCRDGSDITPEKAMEAAHSTRQFLEELARMRDGNAPAPQRALAQPAEPQQTVSPAYPLGPRRLAGAARPQMILGNFGGTSSAPQQRQNGQPMRRSPSGFNARFGLG